MEPLLDRIVRLKKERPQIFKLIGVCMLFLPSLLFAIGDASGYNMIYPPGQKMWPAQFEPDPAFPTAFVFSIAIAFLSPFVMLPVMKCSNAAAIGLAIFLWGILFVQLCILLFMANLMVNHGQLISC
jgi:hypothetical protein